jgi:hypothetical protein
VNAWKVNIPQERGLRVPEQHGEQLFERRSRALKSNKHEWEIYEVFQVQRLQRGWCGLGDGLVASNFSTFPRWRC